ncbi:hypothetical protein HBH98_231170 [Parastagonospora nodorum]|nr:hypothetical protein HBH49_236870 [Parastagonospora nodorum]KAH4336257.1 hypothetical protein HBH98_231170 [Parastagonospora nodorum]KAH4357665.1 hypothetical protein HBH97_222360 [Parastagonospora nodorum]KAH4372334.1 hypothetical protein HBH99_232650 [Parastagonospora nodorum]KAH5046488.1 hypothetical protein HBH96_231180 [Parastagonospora nodorum]
MATRNITPRENENVHVTTGEPARDRIIFVVLAMVCMMGISLILGIRARQLRRSIRMQRNVTSMLFLFMCFIFVIYIIVSAALVIGQGLTTYDQCNVATIVCLVCYIAIKGTVYTFMVERIRLVRSPFVKRSKDYIYLSCLAMVLALYGAISVNACIFRYTALQASDGRCHGGIRSIASLPTLCINLFTNVVLTVVFFYLLLPVIKFRVNAPAAGLPNSKKRTFLVAHPDETGVQKNIRILMWKSIIGSLLIEVTMLANMIQFTLTKGEELGMICFTICMIDVFWDCLVIHWLTFGSSARAERSLAQSVMSSRGQTVRQLGDIPSGMLEKLEGKEDPLIAALDSAFKVGGVEHHSRNFSISDSITALPPLPYGVIK